MAKLSARWINYDSAVFERTGDTLKVKFTDVASGDTTTISSAEQINTYVTDKSNNFSWQAPVYTQVNGLKTTAGAPNGTGYATGEKFWNSADYTLYTYNGSTWDFSVPADERVLFSLDSTGTGGTNETYEANDKIYTDTELVIDPSNNMTLFVKDTKITITYDSATTSWKEFSGAAFITAGDGLEKVGSTVSLNAGNGIAVSSSGTTLDIDPNTMSLDSNGIAINESGITINFTGSVYKNNKSVSTQKTMTEIFPLNETDVNTNKYITLTNSPTYPSEVILSVVGGSIQESGGAYDGVNPVTTGEFAVNTSINRLIWDKTIVTSSTLEDIPLVAGDVLEVTYIYQTEY